jgi:hypothetical protein
VGDIGVANPLASPFSIVPGNCSGQALIPLASCTLTVRFSPTGIGPFNDSFDIPSNDPDEDPVTVSTSGTGTAVNNPPEVPLLVYPADGQPNLGTTVMFRWKKCNDPDGNPVTYLLYVSKDTAFPSSDPPIDVVCNSKKGVLYAGTVMGIMLVGIVFGNIRGWRKAVLLTATLSAASVLVVSCGGGGGTSGPGNEVAFTVSGLDPATTYYWKVSADDGYGNISESNVRSFTTAP